MLVSVRAAFSLVVRAIYGAILFISLRERRAAEEGEMTDEQFEFIMAVNEYKQANHCAFPSYTEILEIAKALGYRKVAAPEPLTGPPQED